MRPSHSPVAGAFWMVMAGLVFALVNSMIQFLGVALHQPSTRVAFFQYTIALVVMIPWIFRMGVGRMLKTRYLGAHVLRVFFSAIGVQLWMRALAYPVPIWQAIALLMTSPLFATLGSGLFLREKVGFARWFATLVGFGGAMLILEPWSESFQWASLLPVGASFFWASYSLMVKKLSWEDSPATMVVYLFLLLVPFNLLAAFPEWGLPESPVIWGLLVAAGGCTALAQWAIAKAYKVADASFVQPFDHVKLPFNVLAGWVVFGWIPPGRLWLGAAVIIGAVTFITFREARLQTEHMLES